MYFFTTITTNNRCIPADGVFEGLRNTGTWNGTQKTFMILKQNKGNKKVRCVLIKNSWYLSAADARALKKTHCSVPSGTEAYYVGMDDFGTALYSLVKPASAA